MTPIYEKNVQNKTWNKMLPVKNKDEIYILNAYVGVPLNLKLGVSVTQTSVAAVVADQSTHAA